MKRAMFRCGARNKVAKRCNQKAAHRGKHTYTARVFKAWPLIEVKRPEAST